jgi:hypothetical protein
MAMFHKVLLSEPNTGRRIALLKYRHGVRRYRSTHATQQRSSQSSGARHRVGVLPVAEFRWNVDHGRPRQRQPLAAGGADLAASVRAPQSPRRQDLTSPGRSGRRGEVRLQPDGSASKNTMNMGGNAMDQVSKAKWDGNKLGITQ